MAAGCAIMPLVLLGLLLSGARWWFLAPAIVVAVSFVVWSLPWWVSATTVLATPVLVGWLAVDNSRGLGHVLTDSHVALRKGSLLPRTDVLRREGLLGWNVRRSPFQRRAGLATVVATSAGGRGSFRLPDVSGAQAAELMATSGAVWDHLAVGALSSPDTPPRR